MFQKALANSCTTARFAQRIQTLGRVAVVTLGVIATISAVSNAQAASTSPTRGFFQDIVGEWIGTCEQSTDGQQAENKYFHAVVKPSGPNAFECKFDYYRVDPHTGAPLPIGVSSAAITIAADGSAKNTITGKGTMMVNKKPKSQSHELYETIAAASNGGLAGKGTGAIHVNGMPLGLGKNGKVRTSKSNWSMHNGVLDIQQDFDVAFRALFITKSFKVAAHYSARRGTDIASLMPRQTQASSKTPRSNRRS